MNIKKIWINEGMNTLFDLLERSGTRAWRGTLESPRQLVGFLKKIQLLLVFALEVYLKRFALRYTCLAGEVGIEI